MPIKLSGKVYCVFFVGGTNTSMTPSVVSNLKSEESQCSAKSSHFFKPCKDRNFKT